MAGRCGIIFVHGIVGNNSIFDFLRPLVSDHYECRFVTLAGHGGDALAFSRTSMAQWKRQVEGVVEEMSARCDRILGVGHSMGCLLLMRQALGQRLSGLFLLNPPLCIKPRLSLLTNAIKVAVGRIQNDPVAQAAKASYGVSIDFNPLHYYGWPQRYLELFREIAYTKKEVVPHIKCPVRAILSAKDEMVAPGSEKILAPITDVVTTILPDSTHYYYFPTDRARISREFQSFLALCGK